MNPIEQAVQAAKAAAESQAALAASSAAPGTQVALAGNTAVGAPSAPAPKLTMDALMMGSMSVDNWIKVNAFGLCIGDNKHLIPELKVIFDATEGMGFVVKRGVKAGNPAQYFYTLDGVNAVGGGSWDQACAKARAMDPKASEYRCVDLPFTLEENVLDKDGKTVLMEAGKRLGYTTSTTNWNNWEVFYKELAAAGFLGKRVHAILTQQYRTNKAGNEWGVLAFKLIGEVELSDA